MKKVKIRIRSTNINNVKDVGITERKGEWAGDIAKLNNESLVHIINYFFSQDKIRKGRKLTSRQIVEIVGELGIDLMNIAQDKDLWRKKEVRQDMNPVKMKSKIKQ